jgi:hypothetical protein
MGEEAKTVPRDADELGSALIASQELEGTLLARLCALHAVLSWPVNKSIFS